MTRLLAELQTTIVARGLGLAEGNLDRFAMLSLIVRQTIAMPGEPARAISVLSLASSLSAPYETVRRNVGRLVANGLCERRAGGVAVSAAGAVVLEPFLTLTHDALLRFVAKLAAAGVALPAPRPTVVYVPVAGVRAAADIMLAVLDGNRDPHGDWLQLVIFSAVLNIGQAALIDDPTLSRRYPDEHHDVPRDVDAAVRAATVAQRLGLPETTVRRQLAAMTRDGRIERDGAGFRVAQAWLNRPANVQVSRASYSNVRRILESLAATGFPFPA